ncbi:hypothetical protein RN001_007554 [Aquatica leii]|uniref:Uncharacterized protein n=1 Tax=Aquatica leii TaxID=1421715 RepID=A0AAN7QID8_9COLE|nr:hypothetical protein RN001_007554 [Aquatica leii]
MHSNMKTLLVLTISICAVLAKVPFELMDDWQAIAAAYADECIAESGADPETAKKMFENHKLVDEGTIRCYFKCLSMKNKFMLEDGTYDEGELIKRVQHRFSVQNEDFVFIFVVFAKVPYELIDDWNALAAVYAEECLLESGSNSEVARKMFENHKLVDEEHIRCYFKCLMRKHNFMSEDGVLDEVQLIQGVQHITPEIARTCITKHGMEIDLCRKGYLVASCVAEENYETL